MAAPGGRDAGAGRSARVTDEDLARMRMPAATALDIESAGREDREEDAAEAHGGAAAAAGGPDAAGPDGDEKDPVFDDRSLTQYPSRKAPLSEEPPPPRDDLQGWITRGVPPWEVNGRVISHRPFMRKRMARLLSEKPREVKNVWSGGLFGCFDDGASCILTCFCPCVQFGMNMAYNRQDHIRCCGYTLRSRAFFSSCILQALVWFLVPVALLVPFFVLHYFLCEGERGFPFDGAGPFECKYWWLTGGVSLGRIPLLVFAAKYGGYFRKKMRERYALPDDPFGEYFFYILLSAFAICQEARTIKQLERRRRLEAVLEEIREEEAGAVEDGGEAATMVAPPAGGEGMHRGEDGGGVIVGVPVKAFDEAAEEGAAASGSAPSEDEDDVPVAVVVVE